MGNEVCDNMAKDKLKKEILTTEYMKIYAVPSVMIALFFQMN